MCTRWRISLLVLEASLSGIVFGQSLQVKGVAKESNGSVLNFVRVTVKDERGTVVGQTVTNSLGIFISQAAKGKLRVECKASTAAFAQNPVVVEPVEIPASSTSVETKCTFDEITLSAEYWKKAAQVVDVRVVQTKDATAADAEWSRITSVGLPPDSVAAAAHQFKTMSWSNKITDPSFSVYSGIDIDSISKAIKGDQNAMKVLPTSVINDVHSYQLIPDKMMMTGH